MQLLIFAGLVCYLILQGTDPFCDGLYLLILFSEAGFSGLQGFLDGFILICNVGVLLLLLQFDKFCLKILIFFGQQFDEPGCLLYSFFHICAVLCRSSNVH